jgi:DNA-binding IscR family transcriptional regulator
VEGSLAGIEPPRRAGRGRPGDQAGDLSELWQEVAEAVSSVVDRTTLADLKRRAAERQGARRPMYHI